MFTTFYNESVRNLVIAFGTLFNNIRIRKKNSEETTTFEYRVPLSYGPKERFFRLLEEQNANEEERVLVQTQFPRMAFQLVGMEYDTSRKINSIMKKRSAIDELSQTMNYAYVEVPYNFHFTLDIASRTIDEGLQIVEQILPYFSPDFTITANMTGINKKVDIPIVIKSVTPSEEYTGDMDSKRILMWNLLFDAKSYVYGPQKNIGLIKEATVNLIDWNELENN